MAYNKKADKGYNAKEFAARNKQIIKLRKTGWSYMAIGKELGLSRERVRQVLVEFAPELMEVKRSVKRAIITKPKSRTKPGKLRVGKPATTARKRSAAKPTSGKRLAAKPKATAGAGAKRTGGKRHAAQKKVGSAGRAKPPAKRRVQSKPAGNGNPRPEAASGNVV